MSFYNLVNTAPEPVTKNRQTKFKKKITIDHFEEVRILGKGAFGVVKLVTYKKDRKQYAIKVTIYKKF